MQRNPQSRARIAFALSFAAVLLAGLAWYLLSAGRFAVYEIRSREPVSGRPARMAPI